MRQSRRIAVPRCTTVLLSVTGKRLSASMKDVMDSDVSDHASIFAFARFEILAVKMMKRERGSSQESVHHAICLCWVLIWDGSTRCDLMRNVALV